MREWSTDGALSPADFLRAMQEDIKLQTNTNAALAKGGWAQMTPSDWGSNGAQLRQEYANLRNFANEIASRQPFTGTDRSQGSPVHEHDLLPLLGDYDGAREVSRYDPGATCHSRRRQGVYGVRRR